MKKSIVLLSAGLDSTVNFYESIKKMDVLLCLTFDYGQRASRKEMEFSKRICSLHHIPHKTIDLKWFSLFTKTSLVSQKDIPQGMDIEDKETTKNMSQQVWVPNRNGIFLNIAAGFGEGLGADSVVVGFNKEEAENFPDNSMDFMKATEKAFRFSTMNHIQLDCFTTHMTKVEIVARAKELKVPFDLLWPCYLGEDQLCGRCESCLRYKRALLANGLDFS